MADETQIVPALQKLPAKKRRKPFRLKLDLHHSLKRAAFDPIYQLTTNVFPQLEPRDQAKLIVALLPYIYTPAAQAPDKKNAAKITVNTQVNAAPQHISQETVRQLRELASSKDDSE